MPTKIGNIKISTNSILKHYWRLNYFTGGVALEGQQIAENLGQVLINTPNKNNLFPENSFTIVNNDTVNNIIELSGDIPDDLLLDEAFSQNKGWVAAKDEDNMIKVDSIIDQTHFSYTGDGSFFSASDSLFFFNPFMVYGIEGSTPIISVLTGDWTQDGVIPQLLYKNVLNKYIMVFKGIESSVNKFGVAISDDLISWSVSNGDEPVVTPGDLPFYVSGFIESDSIIEFAGNPFFYNGKYIMFFVSDNKLGYIEFTNPFNVVFISEPILIPFVTDSHIKYLTQIELNGSYYLFATTENEDILRFSINIVLKSLTYIDSMNFIGFDNTWLSDEIEGINSFVYNNSVNLLVVGKSSSGFLSGISSIGLINVTSTHDVKAFNPLIVAPINGGVDWGYVGAQYDFSGKICAIIDSEILNIKAGIKDSTGEFNIWSVLVPLNPQEPV